MLKTVHLSNICKALYCFATTLLCYPQTKVFFLPTKSYPRMYPMPMKPAEAKSSDNPLSYRIRISPSVSLACYCKHPVNYAPFVWRPNGFKIISNIP